MRAGLRAKPAVAPLTAKPESRARAVVAIADPPPSGMGGPLIAPGAQPPLPADSDQSLERYACADGTLLELSFSPDRGRATARRGDSAPIVLTRSADRAIPTYAADGASLRRVGPRLAWSETGEGATLTVQAGDTLSKIALARYGSMDQVEAIFAANADQISDPDLIFPGQMLRLPGGAETSCLRAPPVRRA